MTNIILRDYQNQAVNAVITQLNKPFNFENPVVCMPTGTGKSFVIAEIVRQLLQQKPTFTILVLTHVKELIQQNYDKFKIICPDTSAGIFSAGLNKKQLNHNVVFASIQSIINIKDNLNNIDFIIIDEAHRVPNDNESQYKNLINFLYTKNADLRIIGLTATPFRTGSGSILNDGIFTKIVFDNTQGQDFLSLIQNGYIVNLEPRETNIKINTDGVRITAGDYNQKDLQQVANKISLTTNILNNALELANNRNKFIIFASGVEHAKNISSYLNSQNILTTYVASELKNIERDQRINDFKNGKYKAIVNNDILTTGFDCPDIDCIIMMRPTLSPVLWAQMLGRGMRPSPNKTNCLVLDYTNNLKKLGEINNLHDYYINNSQTETSDLTLTDNFILVNEKTCENCGYVNKIHARFCISCGAPFNKNYNNFATENQFIKQDLDKLKNTNKTLRNAKKLLLEDKWEIIKKLWELEDEYKNLKTKLNNVSKKKNILNLTNTVSIRYFFNRTISKTNSELINYINENAHKYELKPDKETLNSLNISCNLSNKGAVYLILDSNITRSSRTTIFFSKKFITSNWGTNDSYYIPSFLSIYEFMNNDDIDFLDVIKYTSPKWLSEKDCRVPFDFEIDVDSAYLKIEECLEKNSNMEINAYYDDNRNICILETERYVLWRGRTSPHNYYDAVFAFFCFNKESDDYKNSNLNFIISLTKMKNNGELPCYLDNQKFILLNQNCNKASDFFVNKFTDLLGTSSTDETKKYFYYFCKIKGITCPAKIRSWFIQNNKE